MPKPTKNFIAEVSYNLSGIPCIIGVETYFVQAPHKGSPHTCYSDWDYYGYTECEFRILDRKGYLAPWLEKKVDDNEKELIEAAIAQHYKDRDSY